MVRAMSRLVVGCLVVAAFDSSAVAQQWARKMFEVTSHDFGAIPRGAKAEFVFELTNMYMEDVRIAGVRSSCGCTSPRIDSDKTTLKTYEKGAVVARINTGSFVGRQGATVTVTFDRPTQAQVQLHVKAYVYSNVLLEPASVAFGTVPVGTGAAKTIVVRFEGRTNWRILDVKSRIPYLSGEVIETLRRGNRVAYDMQVDLAPDAPAGYLREHLWLMTNDSRAERIPVLVEGHILPEIAVSPSSLFLGVIHPGQCITRQIVVQGKAPFRITDIHSDYDGLVARVPSADEPKTHYVIPMTLTAGDQPGRIAPHIILETDSGQRVELSAYGVIDKKSD